MCYLSCLSQTRVVWCFGKLDGGLLSFGDEHTCQIEWIGAVHIKLFDGMIMELKDMRYVPQLQKNLISVGALKVTGPKGDS